MGTLIGVSLLDLALWSWATKLEGWLDLGSLGRSSGFWFCRAESAALIPAWTAALIASNCFILGFSSLQAAAGHRVQAAAGHRVRGG